MNKTIFLVLAAGLLFSCGQSTNKSPENTDPESLPLNVSDFLTDASPYVDKKIRISGTVVHVCRHGGQRMFIVGESGDERIRITTGEDIAEFNVELEGEMVEVTGTVRELIIDETYLAEWESEVIQGGEANRGEGHEGGVGHGEHHEDNAGEAEGNDAGEPSENEEMLQSQLERIQSVRDEIALSGEDHLSDFWIETSEFSVIKEPSL